MIITKEHVYKVADSLHCPQTVLDFHVARGHEHKTLGIYLALGTALTTLSRLSASDVSVNEAEIEDAIWHLLVTTNVLDSDGYNPIGSVIENLDSINGNPGRRTPRTILDECVSIIRDMPNCRDDEIALRMFELNIGLVVLCARRYAK